jgi:hypothetical protein
VFFVLVVGGFVRKIDTGPGARTTLAFFGHKTSVPDFLLHCDKPGAPACVPPKLKS